jgi:ubiquinone/menaquinone biosynthesis C-methylase UbiE
MSEINLMDRYPRSQRPLDERGAVITEEVREVARRYERDFFDGDRLYGYGGYHYHPRFWTETVQRFREHYQLADDAAILDVGAGKGFMLYDFMKAMPNATLAGIDISQYAYDNAIAEVKPFLTVGDAKELPYEDDSFDLVISITTVHNLHRDDCIQALHEIERVGRGNAFVTVDAWHNEEERRRLEQWVLTAHTYMHADDWKKLFDEAGYTGDYYWFKA